MANCKFDEYKYSINELNKIRINDKIDYRNDNGKFVEGIVIETNDNDTILKIKYKNDVEDDDDDNEIEIEMDYTQQQYRDKLGKYGRISKRKANRFIDLDEEDYVDILPIFNGDNGWRYGEIIEDGIDANSGQVLIGYYNDDKQYAEMWTHLDNQYEIAAVGTKCNQLQMLKQHIYDPFFNVKKDKNIKSLKDKLNKCFDYIINDILPQKQREQERANKNMDEISEKQNDKEEDNCNNNDDTSAVVKYLCEIYGNIYKESIAAESFVPLSFVFFLFHDFLLKEIIVLLIVQGILNEIDINELKDAFMNRYEPIMEQQKQYIDSFHVELLTDDIEIKHNENSNLPENDKERKILSENESKIRKIRFKWKEYLNDEFIDYGEGQECKANECVIIKRINYLLSLFDTYFIEKQQTKNLNKSEENELDFMIVFNHCINNKNQYSADILINDFHHIQLYNSSHYSLIDECKNDKLCVINKYYNREKGDSYFGYTQSFEVNIIATMIKFHVTYQHTMNAQTTVNNKKFTTEILDGDDDDVDDGDDYDECINIGSVTNKSTTSLRSLSINSLSREPTRSIIETYKPKMANFSFGKRFYYTDYFAKSEKYINKPKYKNLKIELLQNDIYRLNIENYLDYLQNAVHHSLCNFAKKLKCKHYGEDNDANEIPAGLTITISHLLSILLYTNHTELQYSFKKYGTRYSEKIKTLKRLKHENSKIGWWYIFLYQTVLFYGNDCNSKCDKFYHGLSCKLLFSSFNPRFNSPISTTTDITIAQSFAENGIILVLKPNQSTQDRYFDVCWISCYPQEKEKLFVAATDLFIFDIRYHDPKENRLHNVTNYKDIQAMRLFDYIFNKNCPFNHKLLKQKTQKLLIKYLQQNMDIIKEWNKENMINELNQIFDEQDYDSDCIDFDINNCHQEDDQDNNQSFIHQHISKIKGNDKWMQFQDFCKKTLKNKNSNKIPQYLQELFGYMMKQLSEKKEINMIKTEYLTLNKELQSILNTIHCMDKVRYTQEFICKIQGSEFEKFMNLPNGKEYEAQPIECRLCDKTVTFVPMLIKNDAYFPEYCSIGIEIESIECNNDDDDDIDDNKVSLHWSFAVKEINYQCGTESYLKDVDEDHYDGFKAFENSLLTGLKQLTLIIYVR